jgi:hypothetical protein
MTKELGKGWLSRGLLLESDDQLQEAMNGSAAARSGRRRKKRRGVGPETDELDFVVAEAVGFGIEDAAGCLVDGVLAVVVAAAEATPSEEQ